MARQLKSLNVVSNPVLLYAHLGTSISHLVVHVAIADMSTFAAIVSMPQGFPKNAIKQSPKRETAGQPAPKN